MSRKTLEVNSLEFAYAAATRASAGFVRNGFFRLGPLSFTLPSSEFLAIIGPNGSGKSTLLDLLGGLIRPARGEVSFGGSEIAALAPRERARRVAYVRQEAPLVFPIRVEEFVLLGRFPFSDWLGFHSPRDHQMARWALEVTSLTRLAGRRMDEISGGERQRAVLARALAQEPELLLLDEPTANLDLNFQVELLRLIRSLAEKENFTVVAVMHELNLASEFADLLLLLKAGRLFRFGGPQEVLTRNSLEQCYGLPVSVDANPYSGRPRVTLSAKR